MISPASQTQSKGATVQHCATEHRRDFNTSSFQTDYHSGEPWQPQNKTSALKVYIFFSG